eukprot:TRINITY_DN67115_c0_g1_i1.p1 TRINITY_DN67115_c0_g1~~TRINITY_DN67115_c0_g1_i1.p1  ORF type:complete len:205 (-),score=55.99 TRINITY_DN67115_c0_g1_i1:231-758(-)
MVSASAGEVLILEGNDAAPPGVVKPSFLLPAYDLTPASPPSRVLPQSSVADCEPEGLARPSTPMVSSDSRPPSASGERSRCLSQGFVKLSEVEATMRLNKTLESDNAQLEAEMCSLLRQNLQMRENIATMEAMLGFNEEHDEKEEEEEQQQENPEEDVADEHFLGLAGSAEPAHG